MKEKIIATEFDAEYPGQHDKWIWYYARCPFCKVKNTFVVSVESDFGLLPTDDHGSVCWHFRDIVYIMSKVAVEFVKTTI